MTTRYFAPTDVSQAVVIRAEHGAVPVAGGTVALAIDQRPPHDDRPVLDLSRTGTARYERIGDTVHLGATVTYRTVLDADAIAPLVPLLPRMASGVTGGPQLRNRATIGGSACFANPASEAPACLVALDAVMVILGPDGTRRVPAQEFFLGPFSTAVGPDELLVDMEIPVGDRPVATGYVKIKVSESSWPLATAAVVAGTETTRIAVGATTVRPLLIEVPGTPRDVVDSELRDLVAEWGRAVGWWSDELGSARYRERIAGAAATKALSEAVEDQEGVR